MAKLLGVSRREDWGEESHLYRLTEEERARIPKDVLESEQVLELIKDASGRAQIRALPAAQVAQIHEAISSIEGAEAQGEGPQAEMERLMSVVGKTEEGSCGERCVCCEGCGAVLPPGRGGVPQGAVRNRLCPCGSGKKYKKCCGRS